MRTSPFLVQSLVVLGALAVLTPTVATAQGKRAVKVAAPAAPTAEAKEAARAAYTRGQAEFAAGRFALAKEAFDEAFAAIPNPIVLLPIAESQAKLDQPADAMATLQRYLELRTDAPDRADVEAKIKALSASPGHLTVTSEPRGAELELDGFPTQKKTPAELRLPPGDHELSYSLPGYKTGTEQLQIKPGDRRELALTLEALAEPLPAAVPAVAEAAPAATESAPPESSGRPTTALWITAGVGAAGLVTGSVFGFLALKERSDFNAHPTKASADKGERLALFADVGFGVGVIAVATAAVLYFTSDDEPDATDSATAKSGWRLSAALTPSSAAAAARLTF